METTELVSLKFSVTSTDYSIPLGLRVALDKNIIFESLHIDKEVEIEYSLSDADDSHEWTFELIGKTADHTKIDPDGKILYDALLSINNIEIDGIDLNHIFQQLAIYSHDFNGTQTQTNEKFYGSMGCNGTVTLKFTTPVYLWLLENL